MNIIRKLYKHLRRRNKVERLPTHLITPGSLNGRDIWPIVALGRAKDEAEVIQLMRFYGVNTAAELMRVLPPRPRPSWRVRLLDWLRRLEGTTAYDPLVVSMRKVSQDESRVAIRHVFKD